ncbi:GAF domain-containing protein [Desulfobacula phenolica]|uniref:histidine kinase n=1 Tax=Desulfobacula phenolica TaxID=90732 RepID=A0A1H2DPY7_9BACT|nr:GAF domain-containing protein [Desulfobacula phenolica]SDT84950.1 PAS domain S-box-containing protein [Desulfobacula phenolica]
MVQKPTYEELLIKIESLEKEVQNVKEAYQVQTAEKENHQRFLKFLPYPVLARDAKERVTYLNPAFTKTFGWTLNEMKGKIGKNYVPDSLKTELRDKIKMLPYSKNILQFNTKRLTKNGDILDVVIRIGVDRDKNKNPEGVIIVLKDVTMEKRIDRNRTAMNRISKVLPQYPGLKKLLFYVNTEIKELLNVESANTILLDEAQKEFYFFSVAHDDPTTREHIEKTRFAMSELMSGQVVKTGKPIIVNTPSDDRQLYQLRNRKMGYKIKNLLLVPLKNKDRIIGILAADNKKTGDFDETDLETLNTISATVALSIENARVSRELREAYEELKSLNHAKDKMISHLSHELKTPVAILLSSFKILSKRLADLPEKTWQPTMERVQRNLDRIIGIEGEVSDIVEKKDFFHHKIFSRILEQCRDEFESLIAEETGEKGIIAKVSRKIEDIFSSRDLVVQDIFLNRFVEKRIKAIKPDMSHRNISLIPHLKSSSPIRMPVDPLKKTVDGLIRNAIENTPDGGKIEIFVHQKGNGMQFVVKDHGIGLTQEARKRIFEGFFSTQETMNYSSKRPFDFNAGGKGADLLRMKIFSEKYNFKISMTSQRCRRIPKNMDACPGSIQECQNIPGPECDGMTTVTCFFPFPESK